MPIIETEIWKKNPDKPGTLIFDSQRRARDIFVELKEHLIADGRLPDEYFLIDHDWRKGALFPRDANVFCTVNYGGSEGVYVDVYLRYKKEVSEYIEEANIVVKKQRMVTESFATGKTLGDGLSDLDKMNLVASSITAAFYGSSAECRERYARIASGEESRLYPPRDDRDNEWEYRTPVRQLTAEAIVKKLEKSFGLPPGTAKNGVFALCNGVDKAKLYPENAEIEIFRAYQADSDRGTKVVFHLSYCDEYDEEHRESLCLGVTDRDDIIGATLGKDFLQAQPEDTTSKCENVDITEENDDEMESD